MVLSMFLCVPFVKALQYRWWSYYYTGLIIQHLFQTAYLAVAIWWGWYRDWYWVQSGFLVLRAYSALALLSGGNQSARGNGLSLGRWERARG